MRQFFAILLLFTTSASLANTPTTIHWLMVDLAPFRLMHGPEQGKGSSDQMEQMLIKLLPQYQHQSRFVSFERREVLHADPSALYCSFGVLANADRKAKMQLSIPAAVVMHIALATVRGSALSQQLQQGGVADLQQLLSQGKFTGLLEKGRSYAPVIEQAQQNSRGLLAERSFMENNPVDLLLAGRIDFLIDYPHRISYLQSRSRQPLLDLDYYQIAGAEGRAATYVACSKHPKAAEVITAVNQQLLQLWPDPLYQKHMLSWYDDESKKQLQQLIGHIQQHLVDDTAKTSAPAGDAKAKTPSQ
ncbi:hypothetical protein [Rheinheimera sp.]|uniref:hypothetical protein n=1 Tax=Rheinheimera sp. TaxID=1869214 RepID=UPI002FDE03E4